jgi:hypothetical protein
MLTNGSNILKDRLSQAINRLMSLHVEGERAHLTVPILYPSGAGCCVDIIMNGDKCFVSDMGFGQTESEMYGAGDFYDYAARTFAEKYDVGYDGLSVFAAWASIDNIERAIGAVATASASAASFAILRASEEKERNLHADLFDRVKKIFGPCKVTKTMDLAGRDATWTAHNVVSLRDGRQAVFESVTDSPISVSSKFLMFSDLSRKKESFSLNSVVADISKVKGKIAMLSDVSNMIEYGAPESDFIKYAEAA